MLTIGIILSCLLGATTLLSISQRLKWIELLGLMFPVGIGIQTFLMVLIDWINIPITVSSITIATLLWIAGVGFVLFRKKESVAGWWEGVGKFTFPQFNWCWLLFIGAIVALEVMNFAKTIYFPTTDRDSVVGFDLFGMAIAAEHTFKGLSLFSGISYDDARGPGSYITYTPLVHFSYGYVYLWGAKLSKIVNALFYLSFILAFYGITSRFATHTLTAIVTFFTFLTPEFLAFSSLSGTNVLHAYFASLGVLFFLAFYYKQENSLLWVSSLLMFFNFWTRNEGIVFIAPIFIILLWNAFFKTKNYKHAFGFFGIGIASFIIWNIFLKASDMSGTQVFIFKPFWDAEKASTIGNEFWALLANPTYYGITFSLFAIVLTSNAWYIIKKQDMAVTLSIIVLALVFYMLTLYQINYIWDSMLNVLQYSGKRFLFCFIPLFWFYIAANKNMKWLFEKIDRFVFRA